MRGLWLAVILLVGLGAGPSVATEEYAELTEQPCGLCHLDPDGGGPRTPAGEAFRRGDHRWPVPDEAFLSDEAPPHRNWRMLLGFLHLTAAVLWFGTIFYVHLVLRPQYGVGGLPRAEMGIAWVAMALLALTGVPLTKLRYHHPAALWSSPSGHLLLVKIGLFLVLVLSAAFACLWVSPRLRRRKPAWKMNDGADGRPAWVRVDDRVYDLTGSPKWAGGNHFRRHLAGTDLTTALGQAPHGPEKLAAFPSHAVQEDPLRGGGHAVKIFYFMAYGNLVVAFAILVVLSLWRWG